MSNKNEMLAEKKWNIKAIDSPETSAAIKDLATELGLHPVIATLLYNRGYTDAVSAKKFIHMESEMLCSPFDMKDMDKAVNRIILAVRRHEKITIYGDYDVDGVTSVCTLYLYLKSLGAEVEYYIPNRAGEGYGVSVPAIDTLAAGGTKLIITVDTGITANDEVAYAKGIGVDFVVTDHHECRSDLPVAEAVVNPHRPDCPYPFKELAGVGVVFKLLCALEERYYKKERIFANLKIIKEYADLVAIGTIADVMPIKEENRLIVKYGLEMIENTERVGLAALVEAATGKTDSRRYDRNAKQPRRSKKTKITSGFIGFTLAPRINAAGRVRSASLAVELFLSKKHSEAMKIAEQLCEANKERQAEENKIIQEALDKIEKLDIKRDPVIVLEADDWHHGVIGIVSSRITEKYCRPSILVSFEGNSGNNDPAKDIGKGSGRSVKGLNLVDALCHCSERLVKFGGHELAAGLSVVREDLPEFRRMINEYARNTLADKNLVAVLDADCEIKFKDATLKLAEMLQQLEPYGVGNPIPTFVMRDVFVNEIIGVSEGKHTRLTLGDGNSTICAMYFSNSPDSLGIYTSDKVDVLFNIDINEWLDRRSVQLIVRDIKPSGFQNSINENEKNRFEEIKGGATFTPDEEILPDRDDFAAVYKLIQNSIHSGINTLSHKDICSKLSGKNDGVRIGYIKLKFIVMIMRELNIVVIDEKEKENYTFTLHYSSAKRNLEKSSILRRLRTQMR